MSRERRFFVSDLDTARVDLGGDEAHHLIHVLRLRPGDTVALFDGRGTARSARVAGIHAEVVELALGDPLPANESPLELTLAVAVPKGEKMSLLIQKLTELGVATVQPLVTDHGEVKERAIRKRLERWQRVALEAAKQSGRSRLPRIEPPRPFDDVVVTGTFLLTPGAPPLRSSVAVETAIIAVGPEGGWSKRELELARARSAIELGLGPRTLRAETAAMAAAALVQWLGGDLAIE